jgi:hypothetical protein
MDSSSTVPMGPVRSTGADICGGEPNISSRMRSPPGGQYEDPVQTSALHARYKSETPKEILQWT